MDATTLNDMQLFFKALVDPDRLAIAGRLARSSASMDALSAELGQPRTTILRHLALLAQVGLVTAAGQVYSLDRDALRALARRVLSAPATASPPANSVEKVLADYLRPDGSLKDIPAQLKKRIILYEHIAGRFEIGRHYSEKEVNDILRPIHPDVVSMRRDLFDLGFLNRKEDGSDYWRAEANTV